MSQVTILVGDVVLEAWSNYGYAIWVSVEKLFSARISCSSKIILGIVKIISNPYNPQEPINIRSSCCVLSSARKSIK